MRNLAWHGILVGFLLNAAVWAKADVLKRELAIPTTNENLLQADAWHPYEAGYTTRDGLWICNTGITNQARHGITQHLVLNQTAPQPIVAEAWSRAANVGGNRDSGYSIYLDLTYMDGTSLWGQTANFDVGTHDWQRREVVVLPEKPVKSLSFYLLLRGHTGCAAFRGAQLHILKTPAGACVFDGVPVTPQAGPIEGFQLRDAAARSGFVQIDDQALDCKLETHYSGDFIEATLTNLTGQDRAVTLVYAIPVAGDDWQWLANPRQAEPAAPNREYMFAHALPAGMGRLSRYPVAAVSNGRCGTALGIDMGSPAFFRAGFNTATHELFLAFDLGLAPEKPAAHIRLCRFGFEPRWGFRAALTRYYEFFPDQFRCRTPQQGIWMPFAKISQVPAWEDFGFRFKEGNNETHWDKAHGILTFRYTEPLTWWMVMPTNMPRTFDAALAEAKRRVDEKGNGSAQAFLTSGYHDAEGRPAARLLDTPWCNGAVWSMNSMPGIPGDYTDFKTKWNPAIRAKLYGPARQGDLGGEYVDSSEGYVTDVLDFRRDHFAATETPLTFAPDTQQPAIFRGLIAFEYVRAIARDMRALNKLMMANGTPGSLCWLAPQLDVLGTETDWNPHGVWQPMPDEELLYRRALCRGKPYCFLMNTAFEKFSRECMKRYMRRCLAYGIFPGCFSADASTGHYFTRPELYERDRPVFKKYIPLCKIVAEAGWEPITRAHSSDAGVHVERFGETLLTVFNDSPGKRTATIMLDDPPPAASRDLVSGTIITWIARATKLTLEGEDVLVLELQPTRHEPTL